MVSQPEPSIPLGGHGGPRAVAFTKYFCRDIAKPY